MLLVEKQVDGYFACRGKTWCHFWRTHPRTGTLQRESESRTRDVDSPSTRSCLLYYRWSSWLFTEGQNDPQATGKCPGAPDGQSATGSNDTRHSTPTCACLGGWSQCVCQILTRFHTSGGSSEEEGEDYPPQWISWNKNSETLKKLSFLDKTILNIFHSPNNWLKHTVLQRRSTVASTALCSVAPWCSRRTVSFRPPLGTLTSLQNLGGSWFSHPFYRITQ